MDEVKLIDMMSYLDSEILEDDCIENDINMFKRLFGQLTDSDSGMPFNLGICTAIKIITFIIATVFLLIGIVVFIIKKKKGFKFKLNKKTPKSSKTYKKIFSLATN